MRALAPWRKGSTPVRSLHNEIDSVFDRFFGEDWRWPTFGDAPLTPPIESFVRDGNLVVRADLPGIDPNDVDLTIENDRLTIRGERKAESEEKQEGGVYREVSYGHFERTLALPPGVDPETLKATYKDGILEVTAKAPEGATPKKVPITVH